MHRSKTLLVLGALLAGLAIGRAAGAESPAPTAEKPPLRVGTFDSRAVTAAFAASKQFDRQLREMRETLEQAKQDGDKQEVARLEAEGGTRQKQFHRQGFGTAPVDDILVHIRDRLPEIARRAGVDVIVSKWAITYSAPAAQFVDVTDLIVEPFEPSERTKRIIEELRAQPPLPLEEIEKHHEH
jgi:hypothetical protein